MRYVDGLWLNESMQKISEESGIRMNWEGKAAARNLEDNA